MRPAPIVELPPSPSIVDVFEPDTVNGEAAVITKPSRLIGVKRPPETFGERSAACATIIEKTAQRAVVRARVNAKNCFIFVFIRLLVKD